MRIAIDCRILTTKLTGIGNYVFNLIKSLSSIDGLNSYKLLLNHPVISDFKPDSLSKNFSAFNIPLPVRILDNLILRFKFPKLDWFAGNIDLIHSTSFFPWEISKGKFLLTVHDLSSFKVPDTIGNDIRAYYQKCYNLSIPKSDFIITDSEYTKQDVIELFKFPEEKIKVIPLGIEKPDLMRSDIERIDAKPFINHPFILSVATIEPRKNYVRLIKAFSIIKDLYRIPHKLVIVGAMGWRHEDVLSEAKDSEYASDIIMTGYLSSNDLSSLYYNADVFAYVSIYEGFGLPILEAMAMGLPTVYANNTSMVEVAGEVGIGVDAYDVESITEGLYQLISNSELSKQFSIKGLERASQFTWEKTAKETLEVYKQVAD